MTNIWLADWTESISYINMQANPYLMLLRPLVFREGVVKGLEKRLKSCRFTKAARIIDLTSTVDFRQVAAILVMSAVKRVYKKHVLKSWTHFNHRTSLLCVTGKKRWSIQSYNSPVDILSTIINRRWSLRNAQLTIYHLATFLDRESPAGGIDNA